MDQSDSSLKKKKKGFIDNPYLKELLWVNINKIVVFAIFFLKICNEKFLKSLKD